MVASGEDLLALLLEFIKVFLLLELLTFLTSYHRISAFQEELKQIYGIVGTVDALLSVARTRLEEQVCVADCSSEFQGIEFEGLRHPLIEGCVGNSLRVDRGIVLTGTNMSGKSTFLRTLGLNQILATSLGFAFAERYSSGFFQVRTSISTVDDILAGKSRYFAEAERLLELLGLSAETHGKNLLLIDEILAGTNSSDRIPASISILRKMARSGLITIAATHDLEIAKGVQGAYENFHFSEKLGERALLFDYTIKPGIVHQKNAIRILKYLGYPDEIVSGEP